MNAEFIVVHTEVKCQVWPALGRFKRARDDGDVAWTPGDATRLSGQIT